jgi:hypothetical protein
MGNWFSNLTNSKYFWEGAFIFALILLILAHKVTLENLIEG